MPDPGWTPPFDQKPGNVTAVYSEFVWPFVISSISAERQSVSSYDYKTQTGDPSIVSTVHYFLHNGELTLHYFLTVDCGLVQWPVCQEQKGT